MGRPKNLIPSTPLTVHLDADLRQKLDALLYSDLEGRVPFGAYKRFFDIFITRALTHAKLDLSPFLGTNPGEAIVRGDPPTIQRLKRHLEQR